MDGGARWRSQVFCAFCIEMHRRKIPEGLLLLQANKNQWFSDIVKNQELRPVSFLCVVHHELKIHAMQHFVGQFAKQNLGAKLKWVEKPIFIFGDLVNKKGKYSPIPFFDRDKPCFLGSRSDRGLRLQTFSVLFNLTDLLISLIQGLLDNCLLH